MCIQLRSGWNGMFLCTSTSREVEFIMARKTEVTGSAAPKRKAAAKAGSKATAAKTKTSAKPKAAKTKAAAKPTATATPKAAAKPRKSTPRAKKTAANPIDVTPALAEVTPSHDQIAAKAYEIWESKGRPVGQDDDNWREAELVLGVYAGA